MQFFPGKQLSVWGAYLLSKKHFAFLSNAVSHRLVSLLLFDISLTVTCSLCAALQDASALWSPFCLALAVSALSQVVSLLFSSQFLSPVVFTLLDAEPGLSWVVFLFSFWSTC